MNMMDGIHLGSMISKNKNTPVRNEIIIICITEMFLR